MKLRSHKFLSVLLLTVFLLSGCSILNTVKRLDAAEERVEQKLETTKDAVEDVVRPNGKSFATNADTITPEEAQSIALEHAGFTADQVSGLRAEFEIDDRIPHYDVQFHQERWKYEYEIHGETGAVLSFEKDD